MQTHDRQKVEDAARARPSAPLTQTTSSTPLAQTQDSQGDANREGWKHARTAARVAVGIFLLASVLQMAVGHWMTALFYAASAFLLLAHGDIDKWSKPKRVLFIIAYAALGLAMLYEALLPLKLFR